VRVGLVRDALLAGCRAQGQVSAADALLRQSVCRMPLSVRQQAVDPGELIVAIGMTPALVEPVIAPAAERPSGPTCGARPESAGRKCSASLGERSRTPAPGLPEADGRVSQGSMCVSTSQAGSYAPLSDSAGPSAHIVAVVPNLFDLIERTDDSPARPAEDSYSFLNRAAGPVWERQRELLNGWYLVPGFPR
jgi:hypothetical protein